MLSLSSNLSDANPPWKSLLIGHNVMLKLFVFVWRRSSGNLFRHVICAAVVWREVTFRKFWRLVMTRRLARPGWVWEVHSLRQPQSRLSPRVSLGPRAQAGPGWYRRMPNLCLFPSTWMLKILLSLTGTTVFWKYSISFQAKYMQNKRAYSALF